MRELSFIVDELGDGLRIDEFAYLHKITKKALKLIKMKGDILVNNNHQTVRYVLSKGDYIQYIYPLEVNHIEAENIPIKIVYEDDYLLVIDKDAYIPCIPTRAHPCHTLANALSYYYKQNNIFSTVHFVNRLDKDTRGLMIVAKYSDIHQAMCAHMDQIKRVYRCHVEGHVKESCTIDLPIYKDGYKMKRIIDHRGQRAITYLKVLSYENNSTLVECVLKTGRTHQIRVHLASLGHPLVGDAIYGNEGCFDLESYKICFVHPITKQLISISKCGKVNIVSKDKEV